MSRLVDPTICPDCRARMDGAGRCTGCGLELGGPEGEAVWQHLVAADTVIERIRSVASAQAPVTPLDPTVATSPAFPTPVPPPDRTVPVPSGPSVPSVPSVSSGLSGLSGLSGRTVPAVLLGLGGLFVLVAVSLFLAVTWTLLPLAVKAVLMVGLTTAIGAGATALTRRGLRGSAEALWALTAALLALDLSAAWRSGLLGLDALGARPMTTVGSLALVALGLGVATGARRTPLVRVVAAEVTLGAGILGLTGSEVLNGSGSDGVRLVVGAASLAVVAVLLRTRMRELAAVVAALAVVVWLDLVSVGVDPLGDRRDYWSELAAWRLLAAAGLAAVPALWTGLPSRWRTGCATATLGCLGLAVIVPLETRTSLQVLLVAAMVAAYAVVALLGARVWSTGAALLAAVAAGATALVLLLFPVGAVVRFIDDHATWTTPPGARFADLPGPAAWTLAVVVLAALAGLVPALRRLAPDVSVREQLVPALPAVALLTTTAVLAGSGTPLAGVAAGLVLTAVVAPRRVDLTAAGRAIGPVIGMVVGLEAAALALVLTSCSSLLDALAASALGAAALVEHLRRTDRAATAYGAAAVLLAAWAAYGWGRVADLDPTPRLVVVLLVTAAALLLAGLRVTGRLVTGPGRHADSGPVEVAAVAAFAVEVASAIGDPDRLALALTIAGAALALLSVLRRDRIEVGWAAGVVLFAATLVRLTTDTRLAPELYALPAALLLLAVGAHRMWRTPELGSWRALGAGLNLALVPSLLIALDDPSSLRGLLVGVGGAVALASGLRLRWQAPYLTGAAVLTVLALRFLLPLAADVLTNPLGAWILFGTAGGLLLASGILWEQSLRRLRTASGFVGALV